MAEPIQPIVTPPAAPAPEATPAPPAPVVEPVVEQTEDDKEWDEAAKELFPGVEKTPEKKEEADPADSADPNKPVEPAAPEKPADPNAPVEEKKPEEPAPAQPSPVAQQRETQRQMAQEFDAVKKDVAEALFKDLPLELKDADGDPIKGVEDVMKLVDPRTQQPFTEEAATAWLQHHRSELEKAINTADAEANRITTVNITLKDEADKLSADFADVLKANPDVMKGIWAEYQKTLKMSPDGKIVLEAPVSLYNFISTALKPYATAAQATADAGKAAAEAEEARKAAEELQRKNDRSSRSDIFGGGKTDTTSEEDKEWDDAARDYYGPSFKK